MTGALKNQTGSSAKATCEVLARELDELAARLIPVPGGVSLEASQVAFIGELVDRVRKALGLCQEFKFLDGATAITGGNGDRVDAMAIRVRDALKRL